MNEAAIKDRISEYTSRVMRYAPCLGLLDICSQRFQKFTSLFEIRAGFELDDQPIEIGHRLRRSVHLEVRLREVEVDRIAPAVLRIRLQDGAEAFNRRRSELLGAQVKV